MSDTDMTSADDMAFRQGYDVATRFAVREKRQLLAELNAATTRAERAEATIRRIEALKGQAEQQPGDSWGVKYVYVGQLGKALDGDA